MRAVLKRLDLAPDPSTPPGDPSEFALRVRMIVGPPGSPGEESFDVTVCSPEWLAKTCREVGGIYNARHHLVVDVDDDCPQELRFLKGHRLLRVYPPDREYLDGIEVVTTLTGPAASDPRNEVKLTTDKNPAGLAPLEWSNALARVMLHQGEKIRCDFTKDEVGEVAGRQRRGDGLFQRDDRDPLERQSHDARDDSTTSSRPRSAG